MDTQKRLKGFPLSFNIYAENEQEVEECRQAIIGFIGFQASQCRAVTASKVMQALVGSPYYNGHIYRMDLFDDVIFLLLKTEDHMALCHALNQCFPGLKASNVNPE